MTMFNVQCGYCGETIGQTPRRSEVVLSPENEESMAVAVHMQAEHRSVGQCQDRS